jgi:uncharacterized caspase-like protein
MKLPAFLFLLLAAVQLHGAGRHALIICNQNYATIGTLRTPLAEAQAARRTFAALGFAEADITVVTDASTARMTEAVDAFAARLQGAEMALFF